MARIAYLLLALLPHGCCAVALLSGYWAVAPVRMPCHGDPLLYPVVELSGLCLACVCLWDYWRGGGGAPWRGLLALGLLALGARMGDLLVLEQVAMSALSKAGQGYLLLQLVGYLLRKAGWTKVLAFCPACIVKG